MQYQTSTRHLPSHSSTEVSPGDSLGDVETDKAVMSFDSSEAGVVAKLLVEEGTSGLPVGKVRLQKGLGVRGCADMLPF